LTSSSKAGWDPLNSGQAQSEATGYPGGGHLERQKKRGRRRLVVYQLENNAGGEGFNVIEVGRIKLGRD
jgi:hypothetical protein